MNIFNLLSNNKENLSMEEKEYIEQFDKKLREKIIKELVDFRCNELIDEIKTNENLFKSNIEQILINGIKGYRDMPTKTLIDIYLDKKNESDFICLIESLGNI